MSVVTVDFDRNNGPPRFLRAHQVKPFCSDDWKCNVRIEKFIH